jgi:hypothetical protein
MVLHSAILWMLAGSKIGFSWQLTLSLLLYSSLQQMPLPHPMID